MCGSHESELGQASWAARAMGMAHRTQAKIVRVPVVWCCLGRGPPGMPRPRATGELLYLGRRWSIGRQKGATVSAASAARRQRGIDEHHRPLACQSLTTQQYMSIRILHIHVMGNNSTP